MQEKWNLRMRLLAAGALVAAAGMASGCMSSPTYGTDKTASSQLMSDLGSITSLKDKKRAPIDYSPRPDLVKPSKEDATATAALPAPQDPITTTAAEQWPESPEQRLARIRADATKNQDDPNYDSPVVADGTASRSVEGDKKMGQAWRAFESGNESVSDANARKAAFQKQQQEEKEASAGKRRYLSDPPVEYEQAYASAPTGELGEDEYKKERRRKREARKNRSWWEDMNPF